MTTSLAPKPGKAETVYRQIRLDIETGVYAPGEALSELRLVDQTGASRTPVREALRRLTADGLVDFVPRVGATVSRISLQSARELFEYRALLEPAAMLLIAGRINSDAEMRGQFEALAASFDELAATPATLRRSECFYELTEQFDTTVATTTPNGYLSRSISELRPHTVRLRSIAHAASQRLDVSLGEHQALCRALLDGDGPSAAEQCRRHLSNTVSTIFETLLTDDRTASIDI